MSDDLISKAEVLETYAELYDIFDDYKYIHKEFDKVFDKLNSIPNVESKQGEWIDKAISIIDDMQREGIVDYEQAREFRMRAKIKGADDE